MKHTAYVDIPGESHTEMLIGIEPFEGSSLPREVVSWLANLVGRDLGRLSITSRHRSYDEVTAGVFRRTIEVRIGTVDQVGSELREADDGDRLTVTIVEDWKP